MAFRIDKTKGYFVKYLLNLCVCVSRAQLFNGYLTECSLVVLDCNTFLCGVIENWTKKVVRLHAA
nr:MAG TPA: hypothetical protein [Microviridae sp.]